MLLRYLTGHSSQLLGMIPSSLQLVEGFEVRCIRSWYGQCAAPLEHRLFQIPIQDRHQRIGHGLVGLSNGIDEVPGSVVESVVCHCFSPFFSQGPASAHDSHLSSLTTDGTCRKRPNARPACDAAIVLARCGYGLYDVHKHLYK